jgi:SH3 domain-containing YSC84-like protein 1
MATAQRRKDEKMRKLILGLVTIGLALPVLASAPAREEGAHRLDHSTRVLHEIMDTPDKAIPRRLLASAKCIGIIPGEEKVAVLVGEKGGKGVVVCRNGKGGWGDPVFVMVAGGSFGPQIGISSTDIVMLFMNDRAAGRLLSDKFSLGGDASVAAGPVGRDAAAETDVSMQAEILTYARTHGVFAGASLEGTVVHAMHDDDRDIYGTADRAAILHGDVPQPAEAQPLIKSLDEYSR